MWNFIRSNAAINFPYKKGPLLKVSIQRCDLGGIITDTYIQEDQPLFIQDKPVVIAFNNSEERAEYNEADAIRKAEMEKELRVDVWS